MSSARRPRVSREGALQVLEQLDFEDLRQVLARAIEELPAVAAAYLEHRGWHPAPPSG